MDNEETIEQRISSLNIDLNDLSSKIYQHVNIIYSTITPLDENINNNHIDLKNDPSNCIKSLRYEMRI